MLGQLLNCIEGYLIGAITVRELEEWLVGHLQTILDSGDQTAIHAVNEIDADLVQFSEALLSEDRLRKRLESHMAFACTLPISLGASEGRLVTTQASGTSETVMQEIDTTRTVNEYHLVAEFA